jgi:hypothetical protein
MRLAIWTGFSINLYLMTMYYDHYRKPTEAERAVNGKYQTEIRHEEFQRRAVDN